MSLVVIGIVAGDDKEVEVGEREAVKCLIVLKLYAIGRGARPCRFQ